MSIDKNYNTIKSCPLCFSKLFEKFLDKNGYALSDCNKCGLIFVSNGPGKKKIDKLYENFSYNNLNLDEINIRKDAKRSLELIHRYIPVTYLLDVGCGNGFFLDEARKLGWNTKGLDYSNVTVDYATKKLKLDVIKKDIFQFKLKLKKYKLVTLNQVIEHVINPVDLINKCKSVLDKNGYLYIATPNINSALSRIFKENFNYLIPPIHMTYFNEKSLRHILSKNGFKVIYIGTWSYPVDLASIIKYIVHRGRITLPNQINTISEIHNKQGLVQRIKITLFDKLFCNLFYKILNINLMGTNIEVIAQKL